MSFSTFYFTNSQLDPFQMASHIFKHLKVSFASVLLTNINLSLREKLKRPSFHTYDQILRHMTVWLF